MPKHIFLSGIALAAVALAFTVTDALVGRRHGIAAADGPRTAVAQAVGDRLAPVLAEPRALVYLTARWSVPAKVGERRFRAACGKLSAEHSALAVRCFVMEEDAPACRKWLASLKTPIEPVWAAQAGYSIGAGTLLWLENGRVVACQEYVGTTTARGMVARTIVLWPQPLPGGPLHQLRTLLGRRAP